MPSEILVNTGSGNGMLPDGTKPLHKPFWNIINKVLWHSFQGSIYLITHDINLQVVYGVFTFERESYLPVDYEYTRGYLKHHIHLR